MSDDQSLSVLYQVPSPYLTVSSPARPSIGGYTGFLVSPVVTIQTYCLSRTYTGGDISLPSVNSSGNPRKEENLLYRAENCQKYQTLKFEIEAGNSLYL